MRKLLSSLALVCVVLACAGEASALVQRTFVSGLGLDTNPCSRAEPCRTFAAAIAQTLPGGEVLALDTAGYGPVTITKAISLISPPGVYAGITTTSGGINAINVAAGANDVVVLKGLSLSGLGLGVDGVHFTSGRALRVEGLTISGFVFSGVAFVPTVSARLTVTDSMMRDNGNSGIYATAPADELARVTVERTRLVGNNDGLVADANSRFNVRDTAAVGNSAPGFWAAAAGAVLNLEDCLATDNTIVGIQSTGGLVRVAGTSVTDNGTGLFASAGGSILSRGNNTVEGNLTDGLFTGAFAAK